VGREGNFLGVK